MELGALFLVIALLVLVILFVSRPFMEKRRAFTVSAEEHELSAQLAERDRLIMSLQELDFDHVLGKIPSEDYPNMRSSLLSRAADALRRLDELQPQTKASSDAESRVEAVIAARRADASASKPSLRPLSDDALEDVISARRSQRKEKTSGFCPHCGKPVLHSDRFCPACGKPSK